MSKTIATVNGSPIGQDDLDNAIQGISMEMYRKTMDQLSDEERSEIRELALEKLLARELIYQAALAQGVLAEEEAVAEEKCKIVNNFSSEEEFYATLEKANIDAAAYHRMIRQDLTVNLMTDRQLAAIADPTEEQIEETFRQYPDKMKKPARVRAAHILVKIDEGQREQALERILELRAKAAGEEFSQLAKRHSDCPSAPGGGDLGYFRKGDMVKSFEDAAFSQKVGEIGQVVETQFGFHLIKVLDREDEVSLTLSEATPKIRRYLREEAGAKALKEWVAQLKAEAAIIPTRQA